MNEDAIVQISIGILVGFALIIGLLVVVARSDRRPRSEDDKKPRNDKES